MLFVLNNDEVDPAKFKKMLLEVAAEEGEIFIKAKLKGCIFHYHKKQAEMPVK